MKPPLLLMSRARSDERLAGCFELHYVSDYADAATCLSAVGNRIRGILTYAASGFVIDSSVLDRLPQLEIIANISSGHETVDIAAARARRVIVTAAGGANSVDVAEFAFGLLLDAARNISAGDRHVRAGLWGDRRVALTRRVSGRPLGILGLGHVGVAVAKRAVGFDMPVSYHNRRLRTDVSYSYVADALTLANNVDFLVVALPGGPQTHHLVNREMMDALGPQGVLVNIGRGSVVDEEALVAALREQRLGAAALDVLEHEPRVPPALAALPNVVLAPHQASLTREAMKTVMDLAHTNLEAHFAGRPVLTAVN